MSTTDGLTRRTVLLNCGSFNPITHMHLRMFELAKDYLSRHARPPHEVVEGIVSPTHDAYQTATRQTTKRLAPATHRCRMVELGIQPMNGVPHWVRCSDWEARQPEWLRTLPVLDYYKSQLAPGVGLMFLCGADLFETFNVPDLWRDEDIHRICGDYGLVVITRQGSDPWRTLEKSPKADILKQYKDNIFIVEEKIPNAVSSSAVREAIKSGDSIRYLVPDPVVQYIKDNHLYES
ncbi:unnamed protein product [Oppiella nova]|uniref:Nicotinamide-nucleotide adenylyltransferase n=1 Tax=Oppiella nova TaxID=334625 RepID=A0A7R9MI47_9ACAR|nr:unnamed protein product [Oppiella nova]CAG2177720.1 unnamed protein product [Oppiella nova]